MVVLGYDPGGGGRSGNRKSGVAMLDTSVGEACIVTGQCGSVAEALGWFDAQCDGRMPDAIGIDTFLHWSMAPKGWRPIDKILRQRYADVRNSVQPTNSTAGSMIVQGMSLAIVARGRWPNVKLNEVHPKVLWAEFSQQRYPRGEGRESTKMRHDWLERHGYSCSANLASEDEFDAAICCVATSKGFERKLVQFADDRRWFGLSGR
jgi:hypothetical protein